jgi:hypothetical protein
MKISSVRANMGALTTIGLLLFAMATVGCGGGFQSSGLSGSSAQGGGGITPTPVVDPVTQTNTEIATLNANLTALNTTISGAQGQLNLISLLSLQSVAGTDGTATSNKLSVSIGKLLDGVVTGVQDVYTEIATINTNIQTRIAALNPSISADAQMIAELTTIQTDLAAFKTKVNTAVLSLAAGMVTLDTKVSNGIASLSQTSPLTQLVLLYWVPVETQIQEHHDTLVNLAG